jgi:hypothetical protein
LSSWHECLDERLQQHRRALILHNIFAFVCSMV